MYLSAACGCGMNAFLASQSLSYLTEMIKKKKVLCMTNFECYCFGKILWHNQSLVMTSTSAARDQNQRADQENLSSQTGNVLLEFSPAPQFLAYLPPRNAQPVCNSLLLSIRREANQRKKIEVFLVLATYTFHRRSFLFVWS